MDERLSRLLWAIVYESSSSAAYWEFYRKHFRWLERM